jgi:hypothetical protein
MLTQMDIDEKINIHIAKRVIDDNCIIYQDNVVDIVEVGDIVRISFELIDELDEYWYHDAPYLKVIKIHSNKLLGEIQNINRMTTNKYPLAIGERIWFGIENIIEIPRARQSSEKYNTHLTTKTVSCTGPLFTVNDADSCSYTDTNSNSSMDGSRDESDSSDSDSVSDSY